MTLAGLGLLFAFTALFSWAIGDFYIQQGTRRLGNWETLFLIGVFGFVGLLPFVRSDLPAVFSDAKIVGFFLMLSVITLFGALFLFEGVKRGKLAVIEPIFGLELPFVVAFSIFLGGEELSFKIYILIALIFIGLLFTAVKEIKHLHLHRTILEKGAIYAVIGAIIMGLMDYLTGVGSRAVSPFVTIWFVHSFLAIFCFIYLLLRNRVSSMINRVKESPLMALSFAFFDNSAWVFYGLAMTILPIAITTAITESYLAIMVILGIFVNHEKIEKHQFFGITLVIISVIALSLTII